MKCTCQKCCYAKIVARFIEEDHSSKLASRAKQRQRPSLPGQPSQDMMAYWGIFIHSCPLSHVLTYLGYKFETLSLLPDTWNNVSRDFIENRENEVVSNHAQVGRPFMLAIQELRYCLLGRKSRDILQRL